MTKAASVISLQRYPGDRGAGGGHGSATTTGASLAPRAKGPFRLDLTVWALRRRAHNQVDAFAGGWYRRILDLDAGPIGVAVAQRGGRLDLAVKGPASAVTDGTLHQAIAWAERTLGLDQELSGFYRARKDPWLEELAIRFRGLRPPRFPSLFEAVVNAVVCQQVSLTVGIHLLNRLSERFGSRLPAAIEGWGPGAPAVERVAEANWESLRALGLSGAKSRALVACARALTGPDFDLAALRPLSDSELEDRLRSLPGIGRWSAQYVMLRGLGRWRILPGDDVGAQNSLRRHFHLPERPDYGDVVELSRSWSPYAGLVYFHLLLSGLEASGVSWDRPGRSARSGGAALASLMPTEGAP